MNGDPTGGEANGAEPLASERSGQTEASSAAVSNGAGDELEKLRAELATTRDQLLRMAAEMENLRKRVRREQEEDRRYAAMSLMRDLLPVMDNLQRAAAAGEGAADPAALLAGVKLVMQQFEATLKQHHGKRIDAAVGQPFDPNLHQAISMAPSAEHPPGAILLEAQAGYQLHERVIRPSQVIVVAGAS